MMRKSVTITLRICASVALAVALLGGCAETREPITASPAAATASVDWSRAERIDVVLDSFSFTPDRLTFVHGRAYRLHLKNRADGGHNFDAPAFFGSVDARPDATAAAMRAAGGAIELSRGGAADIYFVPTRAGRFPLECSHFLHASFGMEGEIVVE